MQKLIADIKALVTAPITESLDTVHLFLLVGIVLVATAAWLVILRYIITESVEIIDAV